MWPPWQKSVSREQAVVRKPNQFQQNVFLNVDCCSQRLKVLQIRACMDKCERLFVNVLTKLTADSQGALFSQNYTFIHRKTRKILKYWRSSESSSSLFYTKHSLLSNLAVYNAERSQLARAVAKCWAVAPAEPRQHGRSGRGPNTRLEWAQPEPLASIRARPLHRAPSDHTALLLLRVSDQDQVWSTQHTTVKHQRQKVLKKTIEMCVLNMWYWTIINTSLIINEINPLKKTIFSNSSHLFTEE